MKENDITYTLRKVLLGVHMDYGPGLFESVYERVLAERLSGAGLDVQVQVPIFIDEPNLREVMAFKIDLLLNNLVILELKSVERIIPIHRTQLLTYLRLTNLRLGVLINFNVEKILYGDGYTRIINSR